jgi:hypothetical protein
MSRFGEAQPCRNNCGGWIYFDRDSKLGHPTNEKWLPLEYVKDTGIKTGQLHQCSKRNGGYTQGQRPPQQQEQKQQEQGSTTIITQATQYERILAVLNGITIKLDRVVAAQERICDLIEVMKQLAAPVSTDKDDEASS